MAAPRPVVLVTGGSRGIGAAVARLAAEAGFDVAINYRSDRAAADSIVAACRAAGAAVIAVAGDMSVESDVIALFDRAAELGPVRHVVNNAGITGRSGPLADTDASVIRDTVEINVTGAILVAREAARRLSTRRGGSGGSIVNISSVAATLGGSGEYVWYAATKGAIDSLTAGLSKELAGDGIRVNAVSPGLTETDIHAKSTGDAARLDRLAPMIPMGRAGRADEIAAAVVFLISEGASYISGANLKVSGGR